MTQKDQTVQFKKQLFKSVQLNVNRANKSRDCFYAQTQQQEFHQHVFFILKQQTLFNFLFFFLCFVFQDFKSLWAPSPPPSNVCVGVSARKKEKNPLKRCHVVLKAVTCRGSSAYLSVTASLLSVCGCLGSTLPNTHICCRNEQGQDAEMTLIVKPNARQRRFRRCPRRCPWGRCLTRSEFSSNS